MFLKAAALTGNRTRVNCLEGSYANHYTTNACRLVQGLLQPLGKCFLHFLSERVAEPFHITVLMERKLHGKAVLTMAAVGFEHTPPNRMEI